MQSQFISNQAIDLPELTFENYQLSETETDSIAEHLQIVETKPVHFQGYFEGYMEMYSNIQAVAEYLNAHQGWFCRCAQPMKVEPLGNNGYTLSLGRFGSFGYELEPKIGVVLQPPEKGIYLMNTIPVPGYNPSGYDVDYKASMELLEIPVEDTASGMANVYKKHKKSELPTVITKVKWKLHLGVTVQFPKFIYKLPLSLIQSTGDRLLSQIVCKISTCLTRKVQKDFHSHLELPIPHKGSRKFEKSSPR